MNHHQKPRPAALFAALLAGWWAPVSAAEAGSPPAALEPVPVTLICDVNVLEPEAGARLQQRLVEELEPALAREGMRLVEAAEPGGQIVRVHVITFDEQLHDYGLRLETSAEARLRISSLRCEACSEAELAAVVGESVAKLVAPAPTSVPKPEHVGSAAELDGVPASSRRALSGLGIAGAVLLGVGVSACATGTYLMIRGVERSSDSLSARVQTTDFRPAGAGALVAGAVVTTAGAALLALELERRGPRPGVALRVTPTYLGIHLTRRF
ncbi:MAG: hypothetical protein R6X02_31700 [Enhygromyxa sp.]